MCRVRSSSSCWGTPYTWSSSETSAENRVQDVAFQSCGTASPTRMATRIDMHTANEICATTSHAILRSISLFFVVLCFFSG